MSFFPYVSIAQELYNPVPAPAEPEIVIKIENEVVGHAQGISISEQRGIMPIRNGYGEVIDSYSSNITDIKCSLSRVRFDKHKLQAIFGSGFDIANQRKPFQIEVRNHDRITNIQNVWISSCGYSYVIGDLIVAEGVACDAESIYDMINTDTITDNIQNIASNFIGQKIDSNTVRALEGQIVQSLQSYGIGAYEVQCSQRANDPTMIDISMSIQLPYGLDTIDYHNFVVGDISSPADLNIPTYGAAISTEEEDAPISTDLEVAISTEYDTKDIEAAKLLAKIKTLTEEHSNERLDSFTDEDYAKLHTAIHSKTLELPKPDELPDLPTDALTPILMGFAALAGSFIGKIADAKSTPIEIVRVIEPTGQINDDVMVIETEKTNSI